MQSQNIAVVKSCDLTELPPRDMRSTMLSSPRSAPKRYKGEDDEDDEDFDEVISSKVK